MVLVEILLLVGEEKLGDMMYIYKSRVGIFWIKPINDDLWALGINSKVLGSYALPVHAANAVYNKLTGYWPWDSLDEAIFNAPTSIFEWEVK